jgi:hypothetical protein
LENKSPASGVLSKGKQEHSMADIDRRGFLALTAGLCASCALGGNVLAAGAETGPVDVGPLANYKKAGVTDTFARKNAFFLVNHDGRLYAMSNRCTHQGGAITDNCDVFVWR